MLYLLPNTFSDDQKSKFILPEDLSEVVSTLSCLIAESERSGRRYLLKMHKDAEKARKIPIVIVNEHTIEKELLQLAEEIIAQGTWGLVSDSGIPVVADPGSALISILRRKKYGHIASFPGPSSIILALQLSGLSGQAFYFHGYLPREEMLRKKALKEMEKMLGVTHICIETPYRNAALFQDCVKTLSDETILCVASSITFENQKVEVLPIVQWRKQHFIPEKEPTIFVIRHE